MHATFFFTLACIFLALQNAQHAQARLLKLGMILLITSIELYMVISVLMTVTNFKVAGLRNAQKKQVEVVF